MFKDFGGGKDALPAITRFIIALSRGFVSALPFIVNTERSKIPVGSGFKPVPAPKTEREHEINALALDLPSHFSYGPVDAPFVSNDDVASMDLALTHLVQLGHTQIGGTGYVVAEPMRNVKGG